MTVPQLAHDYAALLRETGGVLGYFWPISIVAFLAGMFALLIRRPRLGSFPRRAAVVLATTYVSPLLILLVGMALPYDGPPHPHWQEPPIWRAYFLYAPLVLQLIVAMALVVSLKGHRMRAICLLSPGLWLSLCAVLPAGIAMVGVGP